MANLTITNLDTGSVIAESGNSRDELLTVAAAGTIAAGTILARSTSTDKLVIFVKGGTTAGNGIPKAVLTYDVVAAAAGDETIRALVSGTVRKERLIIAADGDASNVDDVVLDQLRDYNIDAKDVQELNNLDNQ